MLPDILQRLISLKVTDIIKETLIRNALAAIQVLDQETCINILQLGVRWVLEGEKPVVISMGWLIMDYLQKNQQNLLSELLNHAMLEKLLTRDRSSHNRAEVPLLVDWFINLVTIQAMEETVQSHITDFLRENVQGDIKVLVNVSKLLCDHPHCIPIGEERIKFCEVIIENIAELPMPKAQCKQVAQLVKQMSSIEDLLNKVWEEQSNEELMFRCLSVLHTAMVERSNEPCPALAAVLHLVDPHLIPKSVEAIVQANQGHARTLRTLCEWLLSWPRATKLGPWVLALIEGLELEQQYDVLMEVTLATVERLFMAIVLPAVRSGVVPIVWRMIASTRHSPEVFYKVLNRIPTVVTQLLLENSDSSQTCLQMVVNMSYDAVISFPRTDTMYDPLKQAMKDCSAFHPPGLFAPDIRQYWCHGVELVNTESFKTRERPTTGYVGLNNLGNTCYMNSVLQALFMTHRFCYAVLECEVQSQPLLLELQSLFALLLRSRRRSISPSRLLAIARPPGFQPGYQQDSSEFLTYLLDVLHEQEKLTTSVSEATMGGGAGDEGAEADAMEAAGGGAMTRWTTEEDLSNQHILQRKARSLADFTQATGDDAQQLSNSHSNSTDSGIQSVCGDETAVTASSPVPYESLVQQCFGGRLLISFKCLQCQAESVHTDHFRDIQLAFPPGCSPSHELHIQDLLDYFVTPEQLSGENQYRCDSCGGLRDARRSIQILQSPSHLVLTLKRFQFNSRTGQRAKLLHRVQCSESIELYQQPYKLYGAVVHSGSSMDTGHYYTLARDEALTWHIFNDSLVTNCNPPPWSPPDTPYILFYARPEEQLQPIVDLSNLPQLHPNLMELVCHDDNEWLKEIQGEEERCKKRRKQQSSSRPGPHNPDQDEDNAGNPPGSCGGGGMALSHNRFVF